MAPLIFDPTIKPYTPFNSVEDARTLRSAMKGMGTDEDAIISILTKRSAFQRAEIGKAFAKEFNRNIVEDLKSELGGKFETVILALMSDVSEYLAKELYTAMDRIGTKEDVLTEVLCTRDQDEIRKISDAYARIYGKSLMADISGEVSGDYKKLLTNLITTSRSSHPSFDARTEASKLYNAGEGRLGTDEEAFIATLSLHSFPQLKQIFLEYEKLSGKTFLQAVDSEISGDFKEAVLTVVGTVESLPAYFAERLHSAMTGLGTSDKTLVRILVTRAEVDLGAVKKSYQGLYHKSLESDVKGEVSGDYEKVLVSIIEGN